jgi:hypothetical protein
MTWFSRRRPRIALAFLAATIALGGVATAAFLHHSGGPSRSPGTTSPSALAMTCPPDQGTGAISVQLATPDVTPASHLSIQANGFQSREPLTVAIEDAQGQHYAQTTFQANGSGCVRKMTYALPTQLGAGPYQIIVTGDTSHRTASARFQMHVIPPSVTLDAYTATPGQVVSFAGDGFIPGELVALSLRTTSAPLLHVTATAEGKITGRLQTPKLAAGSYTLTLLGNISQEPASVGFNVQGFLPWVVLSRYTLTPGEGVGFIAHNFAPSEQVLVYLNVPQGTTGTPVLHLVADSSGQLVEQDTWAPNNAVSGANVLTFIGQQSNAVVQATFTEQAPGK